MTLFFWCRKQFTFTWSYLFCNPNSLCIKVPPHLPIPLQLFSSLSFSNVSPKIKQFWERNSYCSVNRHFDYAPRPQSRAWRIIEVLHTTQVERSATSVQTYLFFVKCGLGRGIVLKLTEVLSMHFKTLAQTSSAIFVRHVCENEMELKNCMVVWEKLVGVFR